MKKFFSGDIVRTKSSVFIEFQGCWIRQAVGSVLVILSSEKYYTMLSSKHGCGSLPSTWMDDRFEELK